MTYDPNIPLITESPKTSASPIQVNFSQFDQIFSMLLAGVNYNHMPLNDAKQGTHAAMIMQKQTSDPVVDNDQATIYAKDATSNTSTEPQLFARIPVFLPTAQDTTIASNDPMQLTFNSVGTAGPIYYSFLPGGFLIFFGSTNNITIPIVFSPTPTAILAAIANPNNSTTVGSPIPFDVGVQINTNVGITIFSQLALASGNPYTFTWVAIARA